MLDFSYMDTGDQIAENIQRLIDAKRTNRRAVSLAAGMGHTAVRDIVNRKTKNPTFESLTRIAEALAVDVSEIIRSSPRPSATVAVAGKVGAGARVPLVDAYEKGDGPQVECPPGLSPHGIVAVEVVGDSMEPVYSAGDLLFYTRHAVGVPAEALGRRCVCEDDAGDAWVKQVKPGRDPATFDLYSINAAVAPMYGVSLSWAAPVRLHWPAELAVRIR
jgi:transcriptional regulator with XRE-family HTH domain